MKKTLLPLLLLFCVSDIQNSREVTVHETLIAEIGLPMVLVEDNEMCKPTGVETVTYSDGRTEPAPQQKKKTVTKTAKKKAVKKTIQKKA